MTQHIISGLPGPLRSLGQWMGIVVIALFSYCAAAQTGLTLPPSTTIVSVAPGVAGPGTERTITVSGLWQDACPPVGSSIEASSQRPNAIVFKLSVPLTFAPCAQVLTPYSQQAKYTPTQAGVQQIIVLTNDGRFMGQGELVTQSAGKAHSLSDLTGVWYDPATNGSGLSLQHSFASSDVLVGAWFMFDTQGRPIWYTVQDGEWVTPARFEAKLLSYQAAGSCATNPVACPMPAVSSAQVGVIKIDVATPAGTGETKLSIDVSSPTGMLNFKSVVTRILF